MTRVKSLVGWLMVLVSLSLIGCGSDSDDSSSEALPSQEADRAEIEATLHETANRWRYGDKAVLFEQEFEYIQVDRSYDDYLEIDRIRRMESDTVRAFNVADIEFFDRDSAHVSVEVVFVGPTDDTTRHNRIWTMFYHRDRWIRPSVSNLAAQQAFEELRRQSDSAAEAEEAEGEDW